MGVQGHHKMPELTMYLSTQRRVKECNERHHYNGLLYHVVVLRSMFRVAFENNEPFRLDDKGRKHIVLRQS